MTGEIFHHHSRIAVVVFFGALTMQLRDYQRQAVDKTYDCLTQLPGDPCIVLPTGSGKSLVLAEIAANAANQWGARVLIAAHRKELLTQNAQELRRLTGIDAGIYSAGLDQRDTESQVICCGIQSAFRNAFEFGQRHLLIVDECHLIPEDGDGMYRTFLSDLRVGNPNLRMVGLTATPFRMGTGTVAGPGRNFRYISHEVGVRKLIDEGYLCRLVNRSAKAEVDTSKIQIRGGEYVQRSMEDAFDVESIVDAACVEIVKKTADRKSVLVFCSGVQHAENVATKLADVANERVGLVTGGTLSIERSETLEAFKAGYLRWLVNVDVLTTGFNAQRIDCICILRCTQSPGLFAQIVGRGLRQHSDKNDCLILDFGQNIARHGPLDEPGYGLRERQPQPGEAPEKRCPECHEMISAGFSFCPYCQAYVANETKPHDENADEESELIESNKTPKKYVVLSVAMQRHVKKHNSEGKPDTLRVDYIVIKDGVDPENHGNLDEEQKSEWVCIEHPEGNFARKKADQWWRQRSHSFTPDTIDEAVSLFSRGALAATLSFDWDTSGKFPRPVNFCLGDKPIDWSDETSNDWNSETDEHWDDSEIPF